jgi:membrane protease YdiL (CAAX protease family)
MTIKLKGSVQCFKHIDNRLLLRTIILLIIILTISKYIIYVFAWRISGPISLIIGFIYLTFFLKKQKLSWTDLGLKKDKSYKLVLWFIVTAIVSLFVILLASQIAEFFFDKPIKTNERFGDLSGNLDLTIAWILTGIIIGGFGEELVYRGFMINALEKVISKKYGIILAIFLPALFWGIRHYYYAHGYGSIMVFVMGLYFGLIYIMNGRNLYPGITLHASFDTISFLGRYEGG